ncbi:MAG: hypothetical protein IJI45_17915 [Anaerolineaceae bacterium]|nr:hypothetical protein [Anaerolineaceae bacterium]
MEGNLYGYVRVSTKEQNLDRQLVAMRDFGVPESQIYPCLPQSTAWRRNTRCRSCIPATHAAASGWKHRDFGLILA